MVLWFKTYYPEEGTCMLEQDTVNFGKKREEIEKLTLSRAKGKINMKGFTGLKHLELISDEIEELDLSDCKELELLRLAEGIFDKLDLSKNTKLVDVFLDRWEKPADLSMFSHLKGLKKLNLKGSNFTGSLKSLEECKELEYLNISGNKNIKEGLEFLPETLLASNIILEGSGVYEDLKPFSYDLNVWRTHHKEKKKDFNHPTMVVRSRTVVGEQEISIGELRECGECKEEFRTSYLARSYYCVNCQWEEESKLEKQKGRQQVQEWKNDQEHYDKVMNELRIAEREEINQLQSQGNTIRMVGLTFETTKAGPVHSQSLVKNLPIEERTKMLEEKVEQLTRRLSELEKQRREETGLEGLIAQIEITKIIKPNN